MGLTSHKLQTLVAVCAVVCFAATVWLWPRLARHSWPSLLGRVGMLLASQLLTLAAIGLAANNWGGFYSSWGDLLGTDQSGTASITNGVQPSTAQGTPGVQVLSTRPVPLMLPGASGGGGHLQKVVPAPGCRSRPTSTCRRSTTTRRTPTGSSRSSWCSPAIRARLRTSSPG
jgi:hypothetical protein